MDGIAWHGTTRHDMIGTYKSQRFKCIYDLLSDNVQYLVFQGPKTCHILPRQRTELTSSIKSLLPFSKIFLCLLSLTDKAILRLAAS